MFVIHDVATTATSLFEGPKPNLRGERRLHGPTAQAQAICNDQPELNSDLNLQVGTDLNEMVHRAALEKQRRLAGGGLLT